MTFKTLLAIAIVMATLLVDSFDAHAGASLFVDDATITPRGRCQVESWSRLYAPGQELTAVPACNWDGTEFSLGVSRYPDSSNGPVLNLGLKRLFRDFDVDDWGIGASLGATWNGASNHLDGWNVNLPASFALDPQRRVVLHANLGWLKLRNARATLTGGVGIELVLDEHWTALAEAYSDRHVATQAGLRRSLGRYASLDLLVGRQRGLPHASWMTFGWNVLLPD